MNRKVAFKQNHSWLPGRSPRVLGPCLLLLCLVPGIGVAQRYTILHQFTNFWGQEYPNADLVLAGHTLYGTTAGFTGRGEVFKVNADGSGYTKLRSLDQNGASAGLVLSGTTLYGTTINDGAYGVGTVFKLQTNGSDYTVLKEFDGTNGAQSYGGLILSDEVLYGTTQGGGTSNSGTVFKIHTDGSSHTVLKNCTFEEGSVPFARLVLSGGKLYGTTYSGGGFGYGTVFKVNTDGSGYGVVKSFDGYGGGSMPWAGLLLIDTILCGTTAGGGSQGMGTVFRVNTVGSGFRVLKSFNGSDGANPRARLISAGRTLFGTTPYGGKCDFGTIFSLQIDGSAYIVLKSFTGGDGANPQQGGLLLSDATLYGTTGAGGISNCGVVFSLLLSPAMQKSPQSRTAEAGSTISFSARADGFPPITYEWVFNATNLLCSGTNSLLLLTNVQPSRAGAYTVVVTNLFGASTSAPAMLSVIPPVPRKMVPAISLTGDVGSYLHLSYAGTLGPGVYWQALDTVTLTATPQFYPDLTDPLPSARFYRAWQTNVPSVQPMLQMIQAAEITLTGAIASKVRVDYINQYGPTDAWMTLDTVAMTNSTQPYFDFTMFRQPARLYRIVLVP